MDKEWIKALIAAIVLLFLFVLFQTEIIRFFDAILLPILSSVNEGIFSSLLFGCICVLLSWFWFNKFSNWYYVSPSYILCSLLTASIYWYYRIIISDYTINVSDLFKIGFSDIIFGWLTSWGFVALFVDLYPKKLKIESGTKHSTNSILEDDLPIESSKDDVLGFGSDVDILFEQINNRKSTKSFSIGINAVWGEGKSSFINLLVEKLNQYKNQYIVIRFNPRYSNNDAIQASFFKALFSQLSEYDARFKSSFNDYLRVIDAFAENKYLSAILKTTKLFNREDEKEKVNKAITHLNRRIVVIIEDLDRLTTDEIIEVFKLIDGNASFNNLIFICAYDKSRIHSLIESEDQRNAYSDKFFTWERTLPLRSWSLLSGFFVERLLDGLNLNEGKKEDIKNTIIQNNSLFKTYLHNIRDIKRYINTVKPHLVEIYDEIQIKDYLLIGLVKHKFPIEYKLLYIRHSPEDNAAIFNRVIKLDEIEEYKSKEILKLIFPNDDSSLYRSINSIETFPIYFQDHLFGHLSIKRLKSMFDADKDYKAVVKEILDDKYWNELIEYLDSLNPLSLANWDDVLRYIDIYIHLNASYNEHLNSTVNVGLLLEKRIADRLCSQFNIKFEEYKKIISQRLIGIYKEYPYEIAKQQLWAYKSRELRSELIISEDELLDIIKKSLQDLINNESGFSVAHQNILRACISSIDPNSRKITLDSEACQLIQKSIETDPTIYLENFVFLGSVTLTSDWNTITCDPFWKQIFGDEDKIRNFIFKESLNDVKYIERIRNFWKIFEANDYSEIEFQNQGSVQEKINSDLINEVILLEKLQSIESTVNSLSFTEDTIILDCETLKNEVENFNKNTLYIKKRVKVLTLITEKVDQILHFRQTASLSHQLLKQIQQYEQFFQNNIQRLN